MFRETERKSIQNVTKLNQVRTGVHSGPKPTGSAWVGGGGGGAWGGGGELTVSGSEQACARSASSEYDLTAEDPPRNPCPGPCTVKNDGRLRSTVEIGLQTFYGILPSLKSNGKKPVSSARHRNSA